MKIKKIKSQGEYVYPATIAAAVKDANFLTENDSPMTLGEINLYLNELAENLQGTKLDKLMSVIPDFNTGSLDPNKYYIWQEVSSLDLSLNYNEDDYDMVNTYTPLSLTFMANTKDYNYTTPTLLTVDDLLAYVLRVNNTVSNVYDSLLYVQLPWKQWELGDTYRLTMKVKADFSINADINISNIGDTNNFVDKAGATISDSVCSVSGTPFGTFSINDVDINSKLCLLTGTNWLYRTATKGLCNLNSGARQFAINDCKKGLLLILTLSAEPTPINAELISSEDSVYTYKVINNGPAAFSLPRYNYIYRVQILDTEILLPINIHGQSGTWIATYNVNSPILFTNEWQEYSINITMPENGQTLCFDLNVNKKQDNGIEETVEDLTFYFADINVAILGTTYSLKEDVEISQYYFQFNSPSSLATQLTLPSNIKWSSYPYIGTGKTYQCIIINNLATLKEFS